MSTAQKQELKQEKYLEATAAIIQPIVDSVRLLHPIKVWEDISPQFMVTFWSLGIYDLEVPNDSYQREISKLKKQSAAALDTREAVTTSIDLMNCECIISIALELTYFFVHLLRLEFIEEPEGAGTLYRTHREIERRTEETARARR